MTNVRPDWLAERTESPLEPDLAICDPHHHLWDYPPMSRYLLDELHEDVGGGHRIVQTVFVECNSAYRTDGDPAYAPVGETEFVEDIASQGAADSGSTTRPVTGIVGHANLLLGERVEPVLEAHLAASPSRFRGVRHSAAWDASDAIRESHSKPPPHMFVDGRFREGFARLARHGLSFDAWLFHPQLPELISLAHAFEDTTIILDHVGGPLGIGPYEGQRDTVFGAWKASIAELSSCPNVVVKLGGLHMALCGFRFHKQEQPPSSETLATTLSPYYEHCIDCFGVDRCMFESNFPVDKVSCSYTVLYNSFKRVVSGASRVEKNALFHDTAVRVYRLDS